MCVSGRRWPTPCAASPPWKHALLRRPCTTPATAEASLTTSPASSSMRRHVSDSRRPTRTRSLCVGLPASRLPRCLRGDSHTPQVDLLHLSEETVLSLCRVFGDSGVYLNRRAVHYQSTGSLHSDSPSSSSVSPVPTSPPPVSGTPAVHRHSTPAATPAPQRQTPTSSGGGGGLANAKRWNSTGDFNHAQAAIGPPAGPAHGAMAAR